LPTKADAPPIAAIKIPNPPAPTAVPIPGRTTVPAMDPAVSPTPKPTPAPTNPSFPASERTFPKSVLGS